MGKLIYSLFIYSFLAGVRIASLFNAKARKWVKGRKNFPVANFHGNSIWMHCASLGEFEQGRPVLEALKKQHPDLRIVISFFSPSGFEIQKNYPGADLVCYLPMDGPRNARQFIEMVRPQLVIWVKYEYWYHYLTALKARNIPVLLISAVFRKDQPFFSWYGIFWRKMLDCFTEIFVQNAASLDVLKSLPSSPSAICNGDTRFDRVSSIAENWKEIPLIRDWCQQKKVIVAGSTWEEDEDEWLHFVHQHPAIKFIIAPHNIDPENIRNIKNRFRNSICFSQLTEQTVNSTSHVLIIDNIGMLAQLYNYADITYVGGGFGNDGIHNILEAAVYGKPVIIGPEYERFFEAEELIAEGGGFSVENALELESLLNDLLGNETWLRQAGKAAEDYIKKNKGATDGIIHFIQENRLLTN